MEGQITNNDESELSDSIHFIDAIEPIMKEVLAEFYIGESKTSDFQEETLNRMKAIYTDEQIEQLKSKVPVNYKPPFDSRAEILMQSFEYTRDTVNPKLKEIQNIVYPLLSEKEINKISELREDYLNKVKIHFEEKKKEITSNAEWNEQKIVKKLKENQMKYKLSLITPIYWAAWGRDSNELDILTEISEKYSHVVANSGVDYIKIVKNQFKVSIGRIGNFASTSMSINPTKEKTETSIIRQVLFLK